MVFLKDLSLAICYSLSYINDSLNSSKLLSFYLFAYDTNIHFESDDLPKLVKVVNKELKRVKSWLDRKKLALNIDETNFVLFHSPRKKSSALITIILGNKPIRRTNYVKFLGNLRDEHLSWKYHTSELYKKLSRTAGLLYKLRHYIPQSTLVSLYHSIFSSFLNYGIVVRGLTTDSYLNSLFLLQKKVLRCVKFQSFTVSSKPLLKSLTILKLYDMIYFNILVFVYKALNKLCRTSFYNYFTPSTSVHRFETRQATRGDLFISLRRTNPYGLKTVEYFGCKLWNILPLFLRTAGSISLFRPKLKSHFIDSYFVGGGLSLD